MKEFDSAVIAGQLYPCFVDYCLDGIQFCSIRGRRCEYCNAHFHDCLTNLQEANCTEYCMDQWIQNWKFQNSKNDAENDSYQIFFFVHLGIYVCITIALLLLCACNVRFRRWVLSNIKCLKKNVANNPARGLSSVHSSNASTSHDGIYENIPPVSSNTHSRTSLTPNNAAGVTSRPNVTPNNLRNTDRQDGDGRSHFGNFERDENEHRTQNIANSQGAQPSSSNMTRKQREPVAQHLTRSVKKSNNTRKQNGTVAKNRDKYEACDPLLKSAQNGLKQLNSFDQSVTNAKQLDNGDINRPLGNELSNDPSSGYRALPPVDAMSEDTGYHTDATS